MKHTATTQIGLNSCVSTGIIILLLTFIIGTGKAESSRHGYRLDFTAQQRLIADQIISIFENNSPVIQYGYAEQLGDGRGITAGRAGFTSATGDMYLVVKRFTAQEPRNPLAVYLPRLKQLRDHWSQSVVGLEGLTNEWQSLGEDPRFRTVQDQVVDELYFDTALTHAATIGAQTPLTLLILYDTVVQHGNGEDPDGLPALIHRTSKRLSGNPKTGIDELAWNREFLARRLAVLQYAHQQSTRDTWSESVRRVHTLLKLVDDHNTSLESPLKINPWGTQFVLES